MNNSFDSVGAFLAMGGYGAYVWASFGLTAAVIVGELFGLGARRRALRRFVDDERQTARVESAA